jgi:SAM-dependent methyltransferase
MISDQQSSSNANLNQKNSKFWDELCGSSLAKHLNIIDDKPSSLKKFDDWYFSYYPYLFLHIPFEEVKEKDVLEIGLGYGTVAQRMSECGARYEGLDIATGPVSMVNHRFQQSGLNGKAAQGSILSAPFADNSFDFVIAIGCLHHTGDLKRALTECLRVLRPGGKLIFMVYYSYSYRRFYQARKETLKYFLKELIGYRGVLGKSFENERASYDTNAAGDGAPHTDWISDRSLRHLCKGFTTYTSRIENIDNGVPFNKSLPRRELLKTSYPKLFGLDLYATAVK